VEVFRSLSLSTRLWGGGICERRRWYLIRGSGRGGPWGGTERMERGDLGDMVGGAECGRSWRDLADGGGWGKGKREEWGGRRKEVLCDSALGFGNGDLVLFGARVWDWTMKLRRWMEVNPTIEMCSGGVIRG
jgi:hypothetical protein